MTPIPLQPMARAKARAHCRSTITDCQGCALADASSGPVPPIWPRDEARGHPARFLVIGEAPGQDEDRRGEPFIGKSGEFLRRLMNEVGINDSEVAWGNAVSCYPHTRELHTKGDKARAPTDSEMAACRGNLTRQIDAADTGYLLIVGGTALKAWRPDFSIMQIRGQVGLWWDQWVVMPVLHPAFVLRQRGYTAALVGDLEKWAGVVSGQPVWCEWLSVECVVCGEGLDVDRYDPDGLAWCEPCWDRRGRKAWEKARKVWVTKGNKGEGNRSFI